MFTCSRNLSWLRFGKRPIFIVTASRQLCTEAPGTFNMAVLTRARIANKYLRGGVNTVSKGCRCCSFFRVMSGLLWTKRAVYPWANFIGQIRYNWAVALIAASFFMRRTETFIKSPRFCFDSKAPLINFGNWVNKVLSNVLGNYRLLLIDVSMSKIDTYAVGICR